jgi:hypothetical protein
MAVTGNNVEKLRAAGLIPTDDLPKEYEDVVNGLNDDEVKVILDVKKRLDEADAARGAQPDAAFQRHPPFAVYFVF